jgi:hypothetical protein
MILYIYIYTILHVLVACVKETDDTGYVGLNKGVVGHQIDKDLKKRSGTSAVQSPGNFKDD